MDVIYVGIGGCFTTQRIPVLSCYAEEWELKENVYKCLKCEATCSQGTNDLTGQFCYCGGIFYPCSWHDIDKMLGIE